MSTATAEDIPVVEPDVASARAFLLEARDVHQKWVDCIEHPMCGNPTCADCEEWRVWLARVTPQTGDASWHRRWVDNYDTILLVLDQLEARQ